MVFSLYFIECYYCITAHFTSNHYYFPSYDFLCSFVCIITLYLHHYYLSYLHILYSLLPFIYLLHIYCLFLFNSCRIVWIPFVSSLMQSPSQHPSLPRLSYCTFQSPSLLCLPFIFWLPYILFHHYITLHHIHLYQLIV